MAGEMEVLEELRALAEQFGLTLKGRGLKAAAKAAAPAEESIRALAESIYKGRLASGAAGTAEADWAAATAMAKDPAAVRGMIGSRLSQAGLAGVKVGKPGISLAGVGSRFAKGAGVAAVGAFGVSMLADWFGSIREGRQRVENLQRALDDPWGTEDAFADDYVERQTALKVEAARMRKLAEMGVANPQLLATLQSRAAGDSIPTLGPGEARVGGSAWQDQEVINKALALSDIWEND